MSAAARLGALAAMLALAVLLHACDRGPRIAKLAPSDVVVAFGDSLTFGTGASEAESYPAVLEQLTGLRVIRAGVPGEVTAQGLRRLPDVIEEHKPKLVIVCLGGNDLLRKVGAAQIKANLHAMVTLLKDKGIAVVLVGVPEPALFASAPAFYAELAQELKVPYEGAIVKSVLYGADTRADPIHPNAKGYRRMAEAIAALLKQSGAI